MIPDIHETIAALERDLPGWGWLLRNIEDHPGDGVRGKGAYYANVSLRTESGRDHHFRHCDTSYGAALYGAYNMAMAHKASMN